MSALRAGDQLQTRTQADSHPLRRLQLASLVALDLALVYAAFTAAYWLRYVVELGPPIHDHVAFGAYRPLAALLIGIMMPVLYFKGAYRFRLSTETVDEMGGIFSAATITVAAIVVITEMTRQLEYSRLVSLYLWVMIIIFLIPGRAAYRGIQSLLYRKGVAVRRLVVVGATDIGKIVMQHVMARPDLGYQLVGFIDHRRSGPVQNFGRFRALGTVEEVPTLIEGGLVDEIIVALPASAHEDMLPIMTLCDRHGVGLKLVPDLFEMSLGRLVVDDIAGIPVLDVRENPLRLASVVLKRGIDITISALLLIVSLPLVLVLSLLIRLESPGSVLLWQERVGRNGRRFRCLKLRTMRRDAALLRATLDPRNETGGPIFKIRDDPRLTRVGRQLRHWSLDELPQFWNVLKGEMSLVGPRPALPDEVEQYEPAHHRRLEVKPGMTGLWQVSGRSNLLFDEMMTMDIYYVERWSLALDAKILLRTVIAVLARHGAY